MSGLPSDVPPALRAALRDRRIESVTLGMSGARVLRCVRDDAPALFLKSAPVAAAAVAGHTLADEADRLRWMATRGLPVPAVLSLEASDGVEHLLLAVVPGVDAATAAAAITSAPVRTTRAIVTALADGMRRLHATPVADCPFHHPSAARVAEARERVRAGLVLGDDVDEERRGRGASALLEALEAAAPDVEEAVFTHGDYCPPNVILRADTLGAVAGFVDCGRAGVADPHQDLALAVRSVMSNLGVRWVPVLLTRYGRDDVDARRLRFYTLLDEFF